MKLYDWKSNDTRDMFISYTFGHGWEINAESKSATDYVNKLSGPDFKWASVQNIDDGVLYTENKASFDMLFKIIKGTNFVVDLHLGESE
tara:strand:- start:195 stop:461 length:267 start_codon:yes stop_codon:yes gene_type:complete